MTVMMEFSRVLVPHVGKVQTLVQFSLLCIPVMCQELMVPTGKSVMLKFQLCCILELKMFYFEVHFWSGKQKIIAHQQIPSLISKYLLILLNIMVVSFCALFELKPQ